MPKKSAIRISPSRLKCATHCGWEYKYKYVDKMRSDGLHPRLFAGSVLHKAREDWVMDRTLSMVKLTQEAFIAEAETPVLRRAIKAYGRLSRQSIKLQAGIVRRRPKLTSPERTKEFKQSQIAVAMRAFNREWREALEGDKFSWGEAPLPEIYDLAIKTASKYQDAWRTSPHALLTEQPYVLPYRGYEMNGIIDDISLAIDENGEPLAYLITDAKNSLREPAPTDHYLQLAIYKLASDRSLEEWLKESAPEHDFQDHLPVWVAIDLMPLLKRKVYFFPADSEAILDGILDNYERFLEAKCWLPDLSHCSFCDYQGYCAEALGIKELDHALM